MTPPIQPERFDREGAKRAGYTDQEIDEFLAQQQTPKRPALKGFGNESTISEATRPETVTGLANDWPELAREVGRGATFGLSDRIEAGARALGGETYAGVRGEQKLNRKGFQERNPVIAPVANAAGSLATGRFIPAIKVGSGLTAGSRIASGAVNGAVQGGAAAALSADGTMGDRVKAGAVGAGVGAGVGGTFAGIAEALRGGKKLVQGGRDFLRARQGQPVPMTDADAARETLPVLARSGKSVDQLRAASDAAEDPDLLAEVMGPRGVRTLGSAHRYGLKPEPISQTLDARAMDEAPNFANKLQELTGQPIRDAKSVADEALEAARPSFSRDYAAAKTMPDVESKEVLKIVEELAATKHGRPVLDFAGDLAVLDGTTLPTTNPTNRISVANLHHLREGFDRQIELAMNSGDTRVAAALESRRSVIDRVLKKAGGPAQVDADAAFAGAKAKGEAFAQGERLRSGADRAGDTPEGLQRAVAESRDKAALRMGAASDLQNSVRRANDGTGGAIGNPVKSGFGSPKAKARSALAFDDPAKFEQAAKSAENVTNRLRTRGQVLHGSQTAERLADDIQEIAPGFLESLASGNIPGTLKAGLKVANQGARGSSLDRKARILLAGGGEGNLTRNEAIALLEAAERFARGQTVRQSRTAATAGRLAAGEVSRPR